jgi:hypothetical protein
MVPAITPQKTAKNAHALNLRPAGAGINTIMIAMAIGTTAFQKFLAGFCAGGTPLAAGAACTDGFSLAGAIAAWAPDPDWFVLVT